MCTSRDQRDAVVDIDRPRSLIAVARFVFCQAPFCELHPYPTQPVLWQHSLFLRLDNRLHSHVRCVLHPTVGYRGRRVELVQVQR